MILLNRKEWEISSSNAIVEHVVNKGFKNILIYEKGADGKPYQIEGGKMYALVDEEGCEKLFLSTIDNILIFTGILADFHNAAEGFIKPPGIKIRVDWGKSIEKYRTSAIAIERYYKMLSNKGRKNDFEERTWKGAQNLYNRASLLSKVFKSQGYLKALEKSMINREICLNSISDKSASVCPGGIKMTSIYDMGYNMVEEDIGQLIKRGLERTGNKSCYKEVIKTYSEKRELGEISRTIIKAISGFPYDSIKIISRYMNDKEDEEELLEKFEKYYEREQKVIMGVQDGI